MRPDMRPHKDPLFETPGMLRLRRTRRSLVTAELDQRLRRDRVKHFQEGVAMLTDCKGFHTGNASSELRIRQKGTSYTRQEAALSRHAQ